MSILNLAELALQFRSYTSTRNRIGLNKKNDREHAATQINQPY
jgi:hypothetical protein